MTNSTYVSCSKHAPNSAFFVLYWDFLYIANNNYTQAAGLRVMETKTNDRIIYLLESGKTREEITEEDLWLTLHWSDFATRTLHLYEKRSFQAALPALIKAGFVCQRYVKVDADGQVIRDEASRVIAYQSIKAARDDKAHCGEIVNQFLFCTKEVNKAIDAIGGGDDDPPPSGEDEPGSQNGEADDEGEAAGQKDRDHQHRDTAQGVNSVPIPAEDRPPTENIQQGSQNCTGQDQKKARRSHRARAGSQNCTDAPGPLESAGKTAKHPRKTAKGVSQNCTGEAGKIASNNNYQQESGKNRKELPNSAPPRAIDPLILSQFDFSQPITPDAIIQLSRMIYPPLPVRYKSELDKEAAYAKEAAAAQAIAEWPITHKLGLRSLAATFAYQVDESSPCRYRAYCRAGDLKRGRKANPGLPMRLHQLKSEIILHKISQEWTNAGWWPDYLPLPGLVEQPPDIDLAELAGIDQYERIGMDADTAEDVKEWLAEKLVPYGYEVRRKRLDRQGGSGYAIEVWFEHEDGTRRALRFYRFDEWDVILEADKVAPLGSLEFVRHLAEALRRGQVA